MPNTATTLTGWIAGPPPVRRDEGLAIVILKDGVFVDGVEHIGRPLIVARRRDSLEGIGHFQICNYEDVLCYIDIASPPDGVKTTN